MIVAKIVTQFCPFYKPRKYILCMNLRNVRVTANTLVEPDLETGQQAYCASLINSQRVGEM